MFQLFFFEGDEFPFFFKGHLHKNELTQLAEIKACYKMTFRDACIALQYFHVDTRLRQ